jgi:DNA invertase Pin-like site-specific DNA recombinase
MPRKSDRTPYIPIDQRDPATVRAVILARKSGSGTVQQSESAIDKDVQSQVEECQALIERKHWKLIAEPYTYVEKGKSGYYRVERPVLDAVLKLVQRGEVDVIVVRELERLDRTKAGRYASIGTASRYGVEFRFANLPPDGKLPNTPEGKIYLAMAEEFGEMERDRIVERTKPGRERRLALGIPGGGRDGPPYGYMWPPKSDGVKTHNAFVEDPNEAPVLRELFERIANDESASARSLARELNARGVPTPSGRGVWASSTIVRLLRYPIYCGEGRTARWKVSQEKETDGATGEVHDYAKKHNKAHDEDYLETTYEHAKDAVPVLVDPELWERAQQVLDAKKNFYGKLGRANSPHHAEDTLLHGGYVRCARCGGYMIRQWPKITKGPRYRCNQRANNPNHPCAIHAIPAQIVDNITLRQVARALIDPNKLVALADAAEEQATEARDAVDMADTKLAVHREMEAEIEKERAGHVEAIKALSALGGHEDMIAKLRAELVQLDRDYEQAVESHSRAVPELERAKRRQQILDRISRFRNEGSIIELLDSDVGGEIQTIVKKITHIEGSGERELFNSLDLAVAADLLGMNEADLRAMGIHTVKGKLVEEPETDPDGVWIEDIETWKVIYLLLKKAPHAWMRQLLDDLGVRVYIKPPWTKEERAERGFTPASERVIVRLLADPNDDNQVRPSETKPNTSV